jgi:ribonuclease P protein component
MRCGTSAVEGIPQKPSAATAHRRRGEVGGVSGTGGVPSPGGTDGGRFPKAARLLKHADFDRVYRTGRRQFSAHLTVFWLRRGPEQGPEPGPPRAATPRESQAMAGPRVGLTVSRVMGGSVVRNRIRRRLREAVRLNLARLSASVDVVINPKKSTEHAAFSQLMNEVAEAFRAIEQRKAGRTG